MPVGFTQKVHVGLGVLVMLAAWAPSAGSAAEEPIIAPASRVSVNAWVKMAAPKSDGGRPVVIDIIDPWGRTIWTGATRSGTFEFLTRDWADGPYTIRFEPGGEQKIRVDANYFGRTRARTGLLLRAIDEQRDSDGLAPTKALQGASALLQRIVTLHVWFEPTEVVERHLTFCERQIGFRTGTATIRILGSGAANVEDYEGAYRPGARERSMMSMPPDAVFDFAAHAERKLKRWGYSAKDVAHVFISHSHADHFDETAIADFAARPERDKLPPLVVHAGRSACEKLRQQLAKTGRADRVVIDELAPGSETKAGELQVKAVRATHQQDSSPLCYIIHWRGTTAYYGTDTGYPCAETYAALAREKFDVFVHDATAASADDINPHTDLGDLIRLIGRLRSAGAISPWTRVVATHQSPEGPQYVPDCSQFQAMIGFENAYDGMPIPIAFRVGEPPK